MFPLTPDQHHWLDVAAEDEGWCRQKWRILASHYARETVQILQQETPDFISPDRPMFSPNSPVDPESRSTTEFGDWCSNVGTLCVQDTSPRHQRLDALHQWHMDKHITKRRRCWSMEKAAVCMREGKRTSLWTSAELKPALFRANTLYNHPFQSHQQSTEENTLFTCFASFPLQLFKSK